MMDDALLDDWGWWVRDRASGGSSRCRSIEGRYVGPAVPGDDERQPRRMVDVQLCLAVERAVCHPGFPAQARLILKGWYVLRVSREKIAGRAGIPRAAFECELKRAVNILLNRLDKEKSVYKLSATNPIDRDSYPALMVG